MSYPFRKAFANKLFARINSDCTIGVSVRSISLYRKLPAIPCFFGVDAVRIDTLFTLVNVGIAALLVVVVAREVKVGARRRPSSPRV